MASEGRVPCMFWVLVDPKRPGRAYLTGRELRERAGASVFAASVGAARWGSHAICPGTGEVVFAGPPDGPREGVEFWSDRARWVPWVRGELLNPELPEWRRGQLRDLLDEYGDGF